MIILDANALVAWLKSIPGDDTDSRFQGLFERAQSGGVAIGIPAQAFAEFLVRADEGTGDMLDALERKRFIKILPFDKKAAHETALTDRALLAQGGKKSGGTEPWQKIKTDRQIMGVARSNNATLIVSNDGELLKLARVHGISAVRVDELPIPDERRQQALFSSAPVKDRAPD
jgi:predicted nucleic acid-binding protein